MVGQSDTQVRSDEGRWYRAVPLPFPGGLFDRLRDAWLVITEHAYAVRWPEPGELETALARGNKHE